MKQLTAPTKIFIFSIISIGIWQIVRMLEKIDGGSPAFYLLAALGALTQSLKVEGPNDRTNYNIAWFVYGFAFITLGPGPALWIVFLSHLVEWIWHRYPWYIQSFNIGAHVLPVYMAGMAFAAIGGNNQIIDTRGVMGLVVANLVFVCLNHFLVGLVVKLVRGQSFSESGVFGFLTLFLDFSLLSMGAATALIWFYNPFAALLNILPLYLLYNAIRVPALKRQLEELRQLSLNPSLDVAGD